MSADCLHRFDCTFVSLRRCRAYHGVIHAAAHSCCRVHEETAMTVIKAAAVQLSPVLYSREGTVEKIVRKIHALGRQGVQFATFPETVVPYYPYFSFVQAAWQIIGGREHLRLLDQA